MICSSVNRIRFISPSFHRPDSNPIWRKIRGSRQLVLTNLSGFF
jgi:hypothetical protein